jgi:predicted aconitase with swiveling domain/8-oxo-dGTP pyrophosphatase MutT (NUDIX family)
MKGRRIRAGKVSGTALACNTPLSFLGGVDSSSGKVLDRDSELAGRSVRGKVLCFPYGRGSTVGSYAMYQLKLNSSAPKAIVNRSAEAIVATGAIISDIPMVDGVDVSLIATGDKVTVDASRGTVELRNVTERHVVTCIMANRGKILILKRSDKVGSYKRKWAGVSGFIEAGESDEEAARREIVEEIGSTRARLSRTIPSRSFRHDDTVWTVHPFLFKVGTRTITTDWEHDAYAWVNPRDLDKYSTVPGLHTVVKDLLRPASP